MPLRIVDAGRVDRPIIVCDHCGEEITDVSDGNYQWKNSGESPKGAEVYFTHKRCCAPFERTNRGDGGAMELDCLFVYLANNLKLDWESAKKRVALLDSIGS